MFGSGIRYKTHVFITICFMCMLTGGNQIKLSEDLDNDNEQRLAASGHLYDVFRKRMERMSRGVMYRPNYDICKSTLINNEKSVHKLENILPEFVTLEHEKQSLPDTVQQNSDAEYFENSKINYYNKNNDDYNTIKQSLGRLSQDNDMTYQTQNAYGADLLKTYIPKTNVDFQSQDDKNEQNSILKNPLKIKNNLRKNQFPLYSLNSDAVYSKVLANLGSNKFRNSFSSRSTVSNISNVNASDLDTQHIKATNDAKDDTLGARKVKDALAATAAFSGSNCACNYEATTGSLPPNIMAILEKVLTNLERIDQEKDENEECSSEGTPCDLCGLWNSRTLGFALDITTETINPKDTRKFSGPAKKNILLNIAAEDCSPPKHHNVMDCDWLFMGSALKPLGGPFYMYAQPPRGNTLATFVGYCRVCGGIDTIFGSWSFALPSTDCQNIITAFQHKPDIMHRNNMEEKREERYKNILYKQKFGKKV